MRSETLLIFKNTKAMASGNEEALKTNAVMTLLRDNSSVSQRYSNTSSPRYSKLFVYAISFTVFVYEMYAFYESSEECLEILRKILIAAQETLYKRNNFYIGYMKEKPTKRINYEVQLY